MKRMNVGIMLMSLLFFLLTGCASGQTAQEEVGVPDSKIESIPFQKDQLYAVAYLGYGEMDDISFYTESYLDSGNLPTHYFSPGEFYLIIPRYPDMSLSLYQNDIEWGGSELVYDEKVCEPFVIQCNVSDIFPDATICLTYQDETVEFSPFISLEDGSVQPGDRGLDITKQS